MNVSKASSEYLAYAILKYGIDVAFKTDPQYVGAFIMGVVVIVVKFSKVPLFKKKIPTAVLLVLVEFAVKVHPDPDPDAWQSA